MNARRAVRSVLMAGVMAAAVAGNAVAADYFEVSSTSFKDGELLPRKMSNSNPKNPNCVGENISPQLSWKNAPEGTKSFAILMEDLDGHNGAGVHHFIAYGIAPTVTSFAEGELSKVSDKYVGGKSSQGFPYYSGPCPPQGPAHHYSFVVIATDFDPKELPPGLTRHEFLEKLGQIGGTPLRGKAAAGIVGLFKNPK